MFQHFLKTDQISWKNIFDYPSEFVRIDEHLRMKQLQLDTFDESTFGWSKMSGQEVLEHKRLVYSMRCYVQIQGCYIFQTALISKKDFECLKESFREREDYIKTEDSDFLTLTQLENEKLNVLLSTAADRIASENFFRKFIDQVVTRDATLKGHQLELEYKKRIVDTIMTKCRFALK